MMWHVHLRNNNYNYVTGFRKLHKVVACEEYQFEYSHNSVIVVEAWGLHWRSSMFIASSREA